MDKETIERIDKLPKDGKHFTVEDMMAEELKKTAKKDEGFEFVMKDKDGKVIMTGTSMTYTGSNTGSKLTIDPNGVTYLGSNLTSTTTSGWYQTLTDNRPSSGNVVTDGLTIRKDGSGYQEYEIDFDQVESIEDIVSILKQINVSFRGRDAVRGIEHLVKKK